jgi:hypothetical protein
MEVAKVPLKRMNFYENTAECPALWAGLRLTGGVWVKRLQVMSKK